LNERLKMATLAFVVFVLFVGLVCAVYNYTLTIPTSGIVTSSGLEANPSTIDWGNVTVGTEVSKSVTLTNTGNVQLSGLNMTISNVVGLISYTLTWDTEGKSIAPAQSLNATFTLTVFEYNATNFSFDIIITASYP